MAVVGFHMAASLTELPTCMDDPVDLMPRVMGRTHVVEWEDIPGSRTNLGKQLVLPHLKWQVVVASELQMPCLP
jgi:hypothetical protein